MFLLIHILYVHMKENAKYAVLLSKVFSQFNIIKV